MKMNQEEKKKGNEVSQEDLTAMAAFDETVHQEQLAEDKILRQLRNGEISRSNLYRKIRGDRMGCGQFDWALRCLRQKQEIEITTKNTKGRPAQFIHKISIS
jgi:IS30 family transposase